MYRVTSKILCSWKYRPSSLVQSKCVSTTLPQQKYQKSIERDTCPTPPPPPPPPPKDDRLFWGAWAVLILTGGFAYYAKQQPEVRDWLSLHAAWFDDFIAILFQENQSYSEFAEQCMDDIKMYVDKYLVDKRPKNVSHGEIVELPDVPDENEPPEEETSTCNEFEEKPKCDKLSPPVVTKDICEIDRCLRDLGEAVINNYYTAKEACAYYNRLVEEKMVDFKMEDFKVLNAALIEQRDLVKTSICNITQVTPNLDDLSRYVDCGVHGTKEAIEATRGLIKDYKDKIDAARILYEWEQDKAIARESQVARVEELLTKYVDENQTLFNGLQYETKKPTLKGDADILLHHTLRYAKKLQAEVDDASAAYSERVDRALETLPQGERELKERCNLLKYEVKNKRYEMDNEYYRRYQEQRDRNDKILQDALKQQQKNHEENLKKKLAQKEKETEVKLNKLVAAKVAAEKKVFADLLNEMACKLKIVEDKLNAQLKAERETKRSQMLYQAGASLLAATKKGQECVKVDKELKAIAKAKGDGDKLVETVLKAIPPSVKNYGVVPESVIKERYHRMERAALAVAMVETDGGPLPIFILSWLQSLVLFMKLSCIPQKEIDQPLKEPFKELDTFDLLRRARYYIERNNIAAAVRYVAALEGASRAAAETWHEAARSYLETRQAAEAVIAHAAALGLRYV